MTLYTRRTRHIRNKPRLQPSSVVLFATVFAMAGGAWYVWHSAAYAANETNPQTTWVACSANAASGGTSTFTPLSDSAAAALVTHEPEIRPKNATGYSIGGTSYPAPNYYVPSAAEIAAFHSATDQYGQTAVQANPYNQYVDGLDGLASPSTDDLIQWGAHKWGIPEDWLRAQYVQESQWSQYWQGDQTTESGADYPLFPVQSRVPNTSSDVYESLGITQLRWEPTTASNSLHAGTEPLRWKSTAFNVDYQAATIRFYYDNPSGTRSSWGDASYVPCQQWNSLGGWFEPYPWNNSGQQGYITQVQGKLSSQTWTTSGFINESLTFPPAITFNTGGSIPGDCNADGHVTVIDLSILLSHYGQTYAACDFNGDASVTIIDLSILLSHYGT